MAKYCNLEKEWCEMEKVPSGFGAPRNPHVLAHGVLHSGWQPNPERTLLSPPWFQVDCCRRWPAHKKATLTGFAGTASTRGPSLP